MPFSPQRHAPDALPWLANALVKGGPLTQAQHANQLLNDAQQRAQAILEQAEQDAEHWRQHAARSGYEQGFCQFIEQMSKGLEQLDHLRHTLHERVADSVRRTLERLLNSPELLLHIADAFVAQRPCADDAALRISIPDSAQPIAANLLERVTRAYPSACIVHHDAPAFVVEWGEEVREFDPAGSAVELTQAALASCRQAISAIDHDSLAYPILAEALGRLKPGGPPMPAPSAPPEELPVGPPSQQQELDQ